MRLFPSAASIAALLLIIGELPARQNPLAHPRTLFVQPLGPGVCAEDVALVHEALTQFYGLPVALLPAVETPEEAYYKPRRRYRAEKLLDFLKGRLPEDGYRILGITASDISTTKGKVEDWGVIGLAVASGGQCIISSYRCGFKAVDPAHARIRLAKVAVHEIGHTLGLTHCTRAGCLMQDAAGSVATCDREYDLCSHCRSLLASRGFDLPENPRVPWQKP